MSVSGPETLPISAVVLTYNEEKNVEDCLRSLAGWVGEIYVVDSGSMDGTLEVARKYTDKIVQHPFDDYSKQRNWAQDTLPLQNRWILHVDADERVSPELEASIRNFFDSGAMDRHAGAMFSRRTVFMGRWIRHGGHYPVYHVRLFRKEAGRCEDRLYDQHFLVTGSVATLQGDLIDILTSELDEWTVRHVRWAGAEAREARREKQAGDSRQMAARLVGGAMQRRRWLRSVAFGHAPLFSRAFLYFFYRYVIRLGFLDGVEGLIFHFLHACWFRFYIDAKIWEQMRERSKT